MPFSRKRLIDVFLYTRYAHQPDQRRTRQYTDCLVAVGNRQALLTWMFLNTMWQCALHMGNAGQVIAGFYDAYCDHHGVSGLILASVKTESPGIGTKETKEARRERILAEKAQELAQSMWESNGRPSGGAAMYLQEAREQLRKSLE